MGKFDDYVEVYSKYKDIYGDKVALLYQIGKFHEIYGVDNDEEKIGNTEELATLLNIKLTKCDTSIPHNDRKNPLMAGFNSICLDNNIERLVECGYTVVVVNEQGRAADDSVIRNVAFVQSPGTTVEMSTKRDPNNASVFLKEFKDRKTGTSLHHIGMVSMDITTGKTFWYETTSSTADPNLAIDELTRFFQTFNPVEIIIDGDTHVITNSMLSSWGFKRAFTNSDRLSDNLFNIIDQVKPVVFDKYPFSFTHDSVDLQDEYLGQLFGDQCGGLSPIEYLGFSAAPMARKAFINVLQFCNDHNSLLICNMEPPTEWDTGAGVVLDTNSIVQLGVVESFYGQTKNNSLFSLLSKRTQTVMGYRTVRDRLLNGTTNTEKLQTSYDMIKSFVDIKTIRLQRGIVTKKSSEEPVSLYTVVHDGLRGVKDLDRLHRKIGLLTISPAELDTLMKSYRLLQRVFDVCSQHNVLKEEIAASNMDSIVLKMKNSLNLDECAKIVSLDSSIQCLLFSKSYCPELTTMTEEIYSLKKQIEHHCDKISQVAMKKGTVNYREMDDYCCLQLTKAQVTRLGKKFDGDLVVFQKNKTHTHMRSRVLTELFEKKKKCIEPFAKMSQEVYRQFLENLSSEFTDVFRRVSKVVGLIDMYQCIAGWCNTHNYCPPELDNRAGGASFVNTKKLRHPLVEEKCAYVPQDISLGATGMLLYGVNQSGKSCTMKSLGIAVIMAQAGFWVAADSFQFKPYRNIMTRILGNDNIDRGLSAYAVEMVELRSILQRSNSRTLVLGDELCHGTESASAVSLVSASIGHLARTGTSFIFATHLHELSNMAEVTSLENVYFKHLTVSQDDESGEIVYDRVMQDGSGRGLYGIEVAKFLRLPADVIEKAYEIRNKYFNEKKKTYKASAYNKKRLMGSCMIAGCSKAAEHTHHIRYQCEADESGYVTQGMHKDMKENIAPLCEEHHNHVHHGTDEGLQLVIFGYRGKKLSYVYRKMLKSLKNEIE